MGDRADCYLRLFGTTATERWDDVVEALECADGSEDDEFYYSFDSVNYAQLDDDLEGAIRRAGLSYIWENGAGSEYPPGVECFDATTGKGANFIAYDLVIMMPLDQVDSVEVYRSWQTWIHEMTRATVVVTE